MRRQLGLLGLGLAWIGCAPVGHPASSGASPREPRPGAALQYHFELDAGLSKLSARMCPSGALPSQLVAGLRDARGMLTRVAIERGEQTIELAADPQGVQLSALQPADCVRYELDLGAERGGMGAPKVHRSGDALMVNLAALLWRPADYARYTEAHASFALPPGAQLSVPWPSTGEGASARYTLDTSAFAFHAYAAFGDVTKSQLEIAGSTVELAVLDGLSAAQRASIERWATVQAGAVATLGRLPREHIQIVVLPMGSSSDPIRFGSMTRGGGASVGVLLASDFDEAELLRDWVLVHELSHLLHPFVDREQAWLSEGIATYYQEVLRVRAGLLAPEAAWKRILDGCEQGESMDGSLEQGAAEMYRTHRFAPVYWGGAAVMLLADVELRKQGRTLDAVLMELSRCCGQGSRAWPAAEVGARIDAIAGTPVMRELIANVVRGESFPKLDALYEQLGLDHEGRVKPGAPLAAIRDAIMRAPEPEASLRGAGAGGTSPP